MGEMFTLDQEKFSQLYQSRMPLRDVAQVFGRSIGWVSREARKQGLPLRRNKAFEAPLMGRLLAEVAAACDVTVSELLSRRRFKHLSRARQRAMFIACRRLGYSMPVAAFHLKRADHTTILHGVRAIERIMATDAQERRLIEDIVRRLGV